MKKWYVFAALIIPLSLFAQKDKSFNDSLGKFRAHYIATHEVIKGADKKFLSFYPAKKSFRVTAVFEKLKEDSLQMKTSKGGTEKFTRYGKADFKLNGKLYSLYIYQSPQLLLTADYKDYLFLPFTDLTNGTETYGGGRYIDLELSDIRDSKIVIDFNKAYNPYCAYGKGFRCPIPPQENDLPLAVKAGERIFKKEH